MTKMAIIAYTLYCIYLTCTGSPLLCENDHGHVLTENTIQSTNADSKEAAFLVRKFYVFLWACSKLEHCR